MLARTAVAQERGELGAEHVKIIRDFFPHLPAWVDYQTRELAENDLVHHGAGFKPEELRQAADRLMAMLHPDGDYTDDEQARRRYLTIGRQGRRDPRGPWPGGSRNRRLPRCGARQERRPRGRTTPTTAPTPAPKANATTTPSKPWPNPRWPPVSWAAQRVTRHDHRDHHPAGPRIRGRARGHRRRHPAAHERCDPPARPMRITTCASTTNTPANRCTWAAPNASPQQRSASRSTASSGAAPGPAAPHRRIGPRCTTSKAGPPNTGPPDINLLTLACPPDNRLAEHGWTVRKRKDGRTEWIPPPHLDTGQPRVNNYHHPEKYLIDDDDDDDP